jgi:hypothetical protein
MIPKPLRVMILLAALLAAWSWTGGDSHQALGRQHGAPPDLFYNYYVAPGPYGGVGAQLYLCPVPTPPLVGHTYITYQPLMPHEFLYRHSRVYWRYNPRGGWTRTSVTWQ